MKNRPNRYRFRRVVAVVVAIDVNRLYRTAVTGQSGLTTFGFRPFRRTTPRPVQYDSKAVPGIYRTASIKKRNLIACTNRPDVHIVRRRVRSPATRRRVVFQPTKQTRLIVIPHAPYDLSEPLNPRLSRARLKRHDYVFNSSINTRDYTEFACARVM